jgi:hypothetical protein
MCGIFFPFDGYAEYQEHFLAYQSYLRPVKTRSKGFWLGRQSRFPERRHE